LEDRPALAITVEAESPSRLVLARESTRDFTADEVYLARGMAHVLSLSQGETILVVEDEPAVRRLTCRILTRGGYRVLEAADGPRALDTWDAHAGEIDLLLTDVVMPGMSGKELAERLGIEPVFMSGYTTT
jgi:PleD family two-component response regulator